ncbi:MAG TPA: PAN domain-containing protein [Hyphomicrobiaceae bacterium]|nr:PAN domain-containing protein [Hyphomicrobiaceae bacterium]
MAHGRFSRLLNATFAGLALAAAAGSAAAQSPSPAAPPATLTAAATMERLKGMWIEGPGFDITYGAAYEACATRCLANARCRMIEYYRPERKCNLYDTVRPRLKGGSSDVAIRRP